MYVCMCVCMYNRTYHPHHYHHYHCPHCCPRWVGVSGSGLVRTSYKPYGKRPNLIPQFPTPIPRFPISIPQFPTPTFPLPPLPLPPLPLPLPLHLKTPSVYDYIGVVSVVSQYMVYNCVYYCDTYLKTLPHSPAPVRSYPCCIIYRRR
jgi:hypothetical protein